jgi:UDP-N-acetylglucosamine transferase subunit ALG13
VSGLTHDPAGAAEGGLFASVGSMFPFDRLVESIDDWAARHPEIPVLIQIGDGKYEPRHAPFVRMMPPATYQACIRGARLFVAHAGMGSIISAIQCGRPLLMLPRLKAKGEHTTDHQLATIANIGRRDGLYVAMSVDEMYAQIDALLATEAAPPAPISPYASDELIGHVRAFIHGAG